MNDTFTENIYQVANGYGHHKYRFAVGEWTYDGVDRTFQASGASNEAPDLHTIAERVIEDLRQRVVLSSLPLQWLLDVQVQIEVYDYQEVTTNTYTYAVVYVPIRVTIEKQGTFENNGKAMGLQVVRIGHGTIGHSLNDKNARKAGDYCPIGNDGWIDHQYTASCTSV